MNYLAHSSGENYPEQSYYDHVQGVLTNSVRFAREATEGYSKFLNILETVVKEAALYHDLGKLCSDNQEVLRIKGIKKGPLPINHVDAGAAYLIKRDAIYSALAVYSHHRGLPDMDLERNRVSDDPSEEGAFIFRDDKPKNRKRTDAELDQLLKIHKDLGFEDEANKQNYIIDSPVFHRMVLSCLADADHSDSAKASGKYPDNEDIPKLLPKQRLEALDSYISKLGGDGERNELRGRMYSECRNSEQHGGFVSCDSPVGSGKTTAIMAHLLKQASDRGLRRIFVVLPFTNIIEQSVEIYRKALVLPGEDPESVVAELHHKADFQNDDIRYLTSLWKAPIIVTTAVAFFETLASNKPAALRKLHELPGSAIFVDEAHAALPIRLLPVAWMWMNRFADEWGCYWVLASGSLVKFWKIPGIGDYATLVPELIKKELRANLMKYENNRIDFKNEEEPLSKEELVELVMRYPGPRILIMNTIQNAAVIADYIREKHGRSSVEHLSNALIPEDRSKTVDCVRKRLNNETDDDWVLVATSCVEAGVDFSFRNGFREMSSLLSLLQASGRVNRNGKYDDSIMCSFEMQDDSVLRNNQGVKNDAKILKKYFDKKISITPDLSTKSIEDKLAQYNDGDLEKDELLNAEKSCDYPGVCDNFNVIESDTVTAVVDQDLIWKIEHGYGDWKLLQKKSVSIYKHKKGEWNLKEISGDLYKWTLPYDDFLGYMAGVLKNEQLKNGFLNA